MNSILTSIASCLLLIGSLAIHHSVFAKNGVRIPVSLNATLDEQAVDISGDTIIVGAFPENIARIYAAGENDVWKEEALLRGVGVGVKYKFGYSVDVSGQARGKANLAIVGAPGAGPRGVENSGAVFIYGRSGRQWNQLTKIVAPDAEKGNYFGDAVGIHRSTAVIGAPRADYFGRDTGAVYIFVQGETTGRWELQAKIVPKDLTRGDNFGDTVVIRENLIIVGAPGQTVNGMKYAGAAYTFGRRGETWVQTAKFTADNPGKADRFGTSVAISGNSMIVGAPLHDADAGKDSGAAYVFVPDGDSWKEEAKLLPKDGGPSHAFGSGVAITPRIAIVGARGHNQFERGVGAAYSFVRADGTWQERKRLIPDDSFLDLHFGFSVAMNINTVVISCHNIVNERLGGAHGDGAAAYVYNSIEDFDTPPFVVGPHGLATTTLGKIKHTVLLQNYPNPFNPETWIPYRLAERSEVSLEIYKAAGGLVRTIKLGVSPPATYQSKNEAIYWDGRAESGERVSSGIYFYHLQAGKYEAMRKMLVLK